MSSSASSQSTHISITSSLATVIETINQALQIVDGTAPVPFPDTGVSLLLDDLDEVDLSSDIMSECDGEDDDFDSDDLMLP